MFIAALAVLGLAVLIGLAMAIQRITDTMPPRWLGLVHGVLALTGFSLLVIDSYLTPTSAPIQTAIALLALAIIGGAAMFVRHLQRRKFPVALMAVHGLIALLAYALLIAGVFSGQTTLH